ncbi:MAG: phage major capsid protein, P2 family [Candidatus Accumulibacter sp.]|jgi:P2 family phage major capsid protein|nr:phage major capsid protein, P2 family [Accumulibacter sp.]
MRNPTRQKYNAYLTRLAALNHVGSAIEKFNVDSSIQQTLETKIQESSDFLTQVNNIGVTEQSGQKVGLGIGSTIASTTDTTAADRVPSDPTTLDGQGYFCAQTNFDTVVKYAKLDAWAKFPDFQVRLRDAILRRQALDVMTIGFNGTSRAATSDRDANPLLQDVNIGWLQRIREDAPERRMVEVVGGSNAINVYAGGDYENLDALVFDLVNELIDPWYREDTNLVTILGRALFADKYFPLINAPNPPTEKIAADLIVSQKRVGGLQAVRAPYFPPDALLITRLDNLSRYYQEGARRRALIDNPKRDQIENYESSNDAYVVEDYGLAALAENINTAPPAGG